MLQFQSQIIVDNVPDEMLDNKWECILPSLDLDVGFTGIPYRPIVEEIVFNNIAYSNEEFRVGTRYYNLPSDRESFGTCTLTLFCEQGMLPVYYLQSWRNLMFNSTHQYYYVNDNKYPTNFMDTVKSLSKASEINQKVESEIKNTGITQSTKWKKNIEVYFYGIGSTIPVAHVTLYNAYPIAHGTFNLTYKQDPKRFRIQAQFKFDNLIWDQKYAKLSIISALGAGNPAGTVVQQLISQGLGALMSSDNMMAASHQAT